nr:GNAT family N-acetyltransferase [Allorhizobium sonneratiae]
MPCVFKLIGEADAEALSARFPLVRQRAYHSYSGIGPLTPNPDVTVETQVSRLPFALLAAQGHERNWVSRLVINAGAFAAVYRQGGQPVSACLAFAIDGPLFEIGGVYTLPEARGRGLARKTVATALAELCRRQRLARYQVEETNHASIRLAQSLGLRRYQVLTHYTAAATA